MSSDGSFQTLKLKRSGWLLPLAISLAMTALPCFAEGEIPSHSSEESNKRELLIKRVFPLPEVFDWNGHEVAFKESWLERPASAGHYNLLCFRLSVDQSLTKEFSIQKKSNRSMEFREEGTKGETLLIGTSVFYPLRNFAKIGKGLGEIVHYVEIKNPNAKKVALRVYTNNHDNDTLEKTETVLRFDLLQKVDY
ncbi:MAG: hypothetical protein IT342_24255 [Candidatus Melainabacteria bacterium]|nr:hypothetical protein [Candidatus Melainabacteria bacterium]